MSVVGSHAIRPFTLPVASPPPASQVRGNDNLLRQGFNAHDADSTIHNQSGPIASRPVAPPVGTVFYATDVGAENVAIYAAVGWITLANVSTTVTGSGTVNTLTKWTGATTLGNSIVSEVGSILSVAGDLSAIGTLQNAGTSASLAQSTTVAVVNAGTGTGSGATAMRLRSAAGQSASLELLTATLPRWVFAKGTTAESGSNAGSELLLQAYTDAGALIDNVMSVVRAAGGAVTFNRPVAATISTASQPNITTMANLTTIGTLVAGTVPAARVSAGTFGAGDFNFGAATATTIVSVGGASAGGQGRFNAIAATVAGVFSGTRNSFSANNRRATVRLGRDFALSWDDDAYNVLQTPYAIGRDNSNNILAHDFRSNVEYNFRSQAGVLWATINSTGIVAPVTASTFSVTGASTFGGMATFNGGITSLPTNAGLIRLRDAHFEGGISIGQLSDPYVLATRAFTGGGSLAAGNYEVGITAIDRLGNESFAQQVTVNGVGASGRIEVDIVPIAGAVSYRLYLRVVAGSWTVISPDVTNTFQGMLTVTALGTPSSAPPGGNATVGELLATFTQVNTIPGGPGWYSLNLAAAENSQAAFFFSDYKGINVSFQSKGTGSLKNGLPYSPAGGKTEFDIAFDGDAVQLYTGLSGTKELDFFVYGGGQFKLVMLMQSDFASFVQDVLISREAEATALLNYPSRVIEFNNSVWEAGAPVTHSWRFLNQTDNTLNIEYDARVPFIGASTTTLGRWQVRGNGQAEVLLGDLSGALNNKYVGLTNTGGAFVIRGYNDILTTRLDYLSFTAGGDMTTNGLTDSLVQGTTASRRVNVGPTTGAFATQLSLRAPAGQDRMLIWRSADSARWNMFVDASAESGSNAGSAFRLRALDDTAALIDDPIAIVRAAGGTMTLARPLSHTGATAFLGNQSATSSLVYIGTAATAGSVLIMRGTVAGGRYIDIQSGSSRWRFGANTTTESGSNAGSNFYVQSFDDAGVSIDTPLIIFRAAGGNFEVNRPILQAATTASLAQSATTATLNVGTGTGSGNTQVDVRGAAGTERATRFLTGGNRRWFVGANGDTESGSNAGSNFRIASYDDSGAFIDSVFGISRAAGGTIFFASGRPITGGTYNGQTISSAANFTGSITAAGTVTAPTVRANALESTGTMAIRTLAGATAILLQINSVTRLDLSDTTLAHTGTTASLAQGTTGNAFFATGVGTQSGGAFIRGQAPAGQYVSFVWRTGTLDRWVAYRDNTAESGSDAGSEWSLAAHTDAGTFIDNVIRIQRFAGGTMNLGRPINHLSTLASLTQSTTSATVLIGTGSGSGDSNVNVRTAAGLTSFIQFSSGTGARWRMLKAGTAESGGNAGSAFQIQAFDDAGAFIDVPLSITRAAGASLNVNRPLTHTTTEANLAQSTTTATVSIGTGSGSGNSQLSIRGAAGVLRQVSFQTGTVRRWELRADNVAESGANAGSQFALVAADDAGGFIDQVLTIVRAAAGQVTWSRQNLFPASTTANASIRLPHGTAPTTPVNGDIWTTTAGVFARVNGATVSLGVGGGGSGDVVGPASATDNALVRFDGTTGKLVQDGLAVLSDTGDLTGIVGLTTTGTTATLVAAGAALSQVTIASSTATESRLRINGAAGTLRQLTFDTAGSFRWNIYASSAAESGSNAGSAFGIAAYTDAGAFIDNALTITRASGGTIAFNQARPLTAGSTTVVGILRVNSNTDAASPLFLRRLSATGRAEIGYENESGTVQWRVGMTGAGSTQWAIFDAVNLVNAMAIVAGASPATSFIGTVTSSVSVGSPIFTHSAALTIRTTAAASILLQINSATRLELGDTTLTHTGATAQMAQSTTSSVVNVGSGTGSGGTQVNVRRAAGQQGGIGFQTGTGDRWLMVVTADAESGASAGSNYAINAYDDSGVFIDAPFRITRAALGTIAMVRPVTATVTDSGTGTLTNLSVSTTKSHTAGTVATLTGIGSTLTISGAGGTTTTARAGNFEFGSGAVGATVTTAIALRGRVLMTPQVPANAYALQIDRYQASGNATGIRIETNSATATDHFGLWIGNLSGGTNNIAIQTGTGLVQFGDVVGVAGATASTSTALITPASTTTRSSLRVPHGVAPTAPVDGDIWTTSAGMYVRINGVTVGPLGTGGGGGGGTATTAEFNLGSAPNWTGKFTITDAAITPTSKVLVTQAPGPYTGKGTRADEAEMDTVICIAYPASGSAEVRWEVVPKSAALAPAYADQGNPLRTSANPLTTPPYAVRDLQAVRRGRVRGNVKFTYQVLS